MAQFLPLVLRVLNSHPRNSQDADDISNNFPSEKDIAGLDTPELAKVFLKLPELASHMGLYRLGTDGISHGEEP